ncbi:MAG: phosphatidate cytidylyltransferase [Flavobacteriaceae bacterium]|nr:phosphatidate cytidylyltransferase [Flavobacteriaceae bacterium]
MNNFLTRIFSGFIYAFLIIFSLIISEFFFTTIILIFTLLALVEFQRIINFTNLIPYIFLIIIFIYFLLDNNNYYLNTPILISTLSINSYLTYDLFNKKFPKTNKFQKFFLPLLYISGSSYFIILSQKVFPEFLYWITIYFFSIIWVNNTFAYIIGKNFGKNLLYKNISPKKTWEGFWGGLIFSIIGSVIYFNIQSNFNILFFISSAILLSILATIGDLIQSKFKRKANIKDSGSLIPGHGGFFDRMDSVIYSAPFYYLLLIFFKNVS